MATQAPDRYTYDDLVRALQLGHREGYSNAAADVQSGELTSDGHYDDRLAEADCLDVCQWWLEEAGLLRAAEGASDALVDLSELESAEDMEERLGQVDQAIAAALETIEPGQHVKLAIDGMERR